MKKKYINYLLFILVLSLCIFYFYNQYDGFQTSPVNFTKFNGQLTGFRAYTINENINPMEAMRPLLGNNLTVNDIKRIMERPNGDLMFPYFYINSSGSDGTIPENTGTIPENTPLTPYDVMILPESYISITQQTNENTAQVPLKNPLIFTFNLSRNPKITPINLTNENIKPLFNRIYSNLYNSSLVLVSLILNNRIEYPTVDYSNYSNPVPVLTPKIRVSPTISFSNITVKISLSEILSRFGGLSPDISLKEIKSDGSEQVINEISGTIPDVNVAKLYRLNFFAQTPEGQPLGQFSLFNGFQSSNSGIDSFLFSNSPSIPDSVIQSYFGGILLIIKSMYVRSGFNIVSINLSNPSQEIKVDILESSSTAAPSSILDKIRKMLCI